MNASNTQNYDRFYAFYNSLIYFFSYDSFDCTVEENALKVFGLTEKSANDEATLEKRYHELCNAWRGRMTRTVSSTYISNRFKTQLQRTEKSYRFLRNRYKHRPLENSPTFPWEKAPEIHPILVNIFLKSIQAPFNHVVFANLVLRSYSCKVANNNDNHWKVAYEITSFASLFFINRNAIIVLDIIYEIFTLCLLCKN